jgi:hypothetical protein
MSASAGCRHAVGKVNVRDLPFPELMHRNTREILEELGKRSKGKPPKCLSELTAPPPAEKASARQDQARQASTGDGSENARPTKAKAC